jgi:uncharacterized protein
VPCGLRPARRTRLVTAEQWLWGGAAALLIGFSKTGMPGIGILVVPLLANAFGGRPSVGVMLPMLIFGDIFAVLWYRRHAEWRTIWRLLPWVVVGMAAGTALLLALGDQKAPKDAMNPIIGTIVLIMLGVHLARRRYGDRLAPTSRTGTAAIGSAAGFTTTASNAAGPIMAIYLQAMGMPKERFMGTTAWYFFIVNVVKLPIFYVLSLLNPAKPIMTPASLLFNLEICPVILAGVFVGKWFLPRVKQDAFDGIVLVLAAVAAGQLVVGWYLGAR